MFVRPVTRDNMLRNNTVCLLYRHVQRGDPTNTQATSSTRIVVQPSTMSRIFPLNLAIFIKELTVTPRKGMADSIVVTGARTRVGELLRTIEERERRLHSIRATAFKARDFVEVERARSGGTKTWHLKVNVMFQEIASTQESIRSLKVSPKTHEIAVGTSN